MIMDATPSPQSVGREFVRQYYTLLNKAPEHLHRFYNNFSSFVHGGLDPHNREATLVIGQKQIYTKIQQLRFCDCHAKISQVDAQSTLGNGVVVQVSGELSNNGEPMRRFTQTFVLAAQSPKKYYVHNDIFRYQDLITDDETEIESRSENDEEQEQDAGTAVIVENNNQTNDVLSAQQQPQQPIYYPLNTVQSYQQEQPTPPPQPTQMNGGVQQDATANSIDGSAKASNKIPSRYPQDSLKMMQQQQQEQQRNNNNNTPVQSQSQGAALQPQTVPIEQNVAATSAPSPHTPVAVSHNAPQLTTVAGTPNAVNAPINDTAAVVGDIDVNQNENEVIASAGADVDVIEDQTNQLESNVVIADDGTASQSTQNEPKTYAQFFKSDNISSGINFVSPNTNNANARTPTNNTNSFASRTPAAPSEVRNDTTPNALAGANAVAAAPRTGPRTDSRPGQIRERRSSNANQFSDNHQLFLGNVPHHATEEELRIMFGRFGVIVDLRIHSKPGTKLPGMRATPNYGFITYDDPESVQKCLSNMPLYYPDNSPTGQKLNVEEKKTRMRNETSNNVDRNERDRSDRGGMSRPVTGNGGSGGGGGSNVRSNGDRIGLNRTPNAGILRGNARPFNRNDRQQSGPRGNNNGTTNTTGSGGYQRR